MTDSGRANKGDTPAQAPRKSDVCLLCGREISPEDSYRYAYCSAECYEMDQLIMEDEEFHHSEYKK